MFNLSEGDGPFRLTDAEGKARLKRGTMVGLYLLLAIVILVTGAHAIMLVMSQAPEFAGESGLVTAVLNVIRLAFPVTVELAAIVAGLGFISAKWRDNQKWVGLGIELVWFTFAAANMITFFRVERGLGLETWQDSWINYGLPLSALIAGVLAYTLTRMDPDLKRKDEETAAEETIKMIRFAARRDVAISPQRQAIERQRAWIDFVQALRTQGYTREQIQYMLQDTPELLVDRNRDGTADLLEDIDDQRSPTIHTLDGPPYRSQTRVNVPDPAVIRSMLENMTFPDENDNQVVVRDEDEELNHRGPH